MVDIYTYLRARFGRPNGFQSFIKKAESSNNYIHWDYLLCAGSTYVYISGFNREFHIMVSERMKDSDWLTMLASIKSDFAKCGKIKSSVFRKLETWILYPNKYFQVAGSCADLYSTILDLLTVDTLPSAVRRHRRRRISERLLRYKQSSERANKLGDACLKLSLLTPVLIEAFLNMLILLLCKPEVRDNPRQYEAFIRAHIDIKIFDLHLKCTGFREGIGHEDSEYMNLKRIMDRRNNSIHGNVDPERDCIEKLYFDSYIPLYKETGEHIEHFHSVLERQFDASRIIKDYEDAHLFFEHTLNLLDEDTRRALYIMLSDPYPGYRPDTKKSGSVLPAFVTAGYLQGIRYDDELSGA